jgi:hypothetical protein
MGTAENKATERRIIHEVMNRRRLDLADELFSEGHERPRSPRAPRGLVLSDNWRPLRNLAAGVR